MGGRDSDGGGGGVDMVRERADAVGEALMSEGRRRGIGRLGDRVGG